MLILDALLKVFDTCPAANIFVYMREIGTASSALFNLSNEK
jgi:hypothetical protein